MVNITVLNAGVTKLSRCHEQNGAIINTGSNTRVFPTMTSQNVKKVYCQATSVIRS